MTMVSEEQAGNQLSGLIDRVMNGETIIITRLNKPVLQLMSLQSTECPEKPQALFGSGKGTLLYMAPDFNAPLEDFKEYME